MQKLLIVLMLLLVLLSASLFPFKITLENKTRLSEKALLQRPTSISLTEDGLFLVIDWKASDIKVYQEDGKLLNVIGSKGFGPNEFASPFFSCYNNQKLIVFDFGQAKLLIHERKNKLEFQRAKSFTFLENVYDMILQGNELYIAGDKPCGEMAGRDGNMESLFSFNLDKYGKFSYYLPAYKKFGFSSKSQLKSEFFGKRDLMAVGTQGIFDMAGGYAYFCWQADLKIFKINLGTKEVKTFGKKTSYYVKPRSSHKLINAILSRQKELIRKFKDQASYIRKVIATQKYVMILYTAPALKNNGSNLIIQAYSPGGDFIAEQIIPGDIGYPMVFDKKQDVLYSITSDTGEDEEWYSLTKHKISDK